MAPARNGGAREANSAAQSGSRERPPLPPQLLLHRVVQRLLHHFPLRVLLLHLLLRLRLDAVLLLGLGLGVLVLKLGLGSGLVPGAARAGQHGRKVLLLPVLLGREVWARARGVVRARTAHARRQAATSAGTGACAAARRRRLSLRGLPDGLVVSAYRALPGCAQLSRRRPRAGQGRAAPAPIGSWPPPASP